MSPAIDAPVALAFDPTAWLAALTSIAGGYALLADWRLWLGVEPSDGEALSVVMAHLIGRPDCQEAVKRAIEQRQNGEAR